MSVTYTNDVSRPYGDRPYAEPAQPTLSEETFVPRYARTGKAARTSAGGGKVKAWMILAPVGVLVLGGVAAAMLMTPREDTALSSNPLAEPAATAPVLPAAPAAAAPTTTSAAPAPVVAAPATAPVAREAAPVRRATPAPTARRAAPAPAPRTQAPAPVQPTSPQPYSPATSTLNSAPATPAPAPAPAPTTAPPIVVSPLG